MTYKQHVILTNMLMICTSSTLDQTPRHQRKQLMWCTDGQPWMTWKPTKDRRTYYWFFQKKERFPTHAYQQNRNSESNWGKDIWHHCYQQSDIGRTCWWNRTKSRHEAVSTASTQTSLTLGLHGRPHSHYVCMVDFTHTGSAWSTSLTLGLHGRPHIGSAWSTSLTLGLSGRPHTGRPHAHWVSVVDLTLGLQSDLEQVQRHYEHYIPGHAPKIEALAYA